MGFFQKLGEFIGDIVESEMNRHQRVAQRVDKKLDQYDRNNMSVEGREKYDSMRRGVDRCLSADPKETLENIDEFFGNK